MNHPCHNEVADLHRFFEDWFTARIENSQENFARFSGVIADGFEMISPDGRTTDRNSLMSRLRSARGTYRDGSFRIWIENCRTRPLNDNLHLVLYEEWQERDGRSTGRLSSAVFRDRHDAPNAVEWLHLHETWLPNSTEE